MVPNDLDDVRRQSEFDRLLTSAHIHRRRGDYEQAEQCINQALQIKPNDLEAREFAADLLFARGELEQAAQQYKSIYEQDKTRSTTEEKYARTIVQIAEGKRQQELLREMLENPRKFQTPTRSPVVAAVLSGIPGLGHIYCNQYYKGIGLFLVTVLSWMIFYALSPTMPDYSGLSDRAADLINSSSRIKYFAENLSVSAILYMCIAIFAHVYTFVDAAVTADKTKPKKDSEPE